MAYAPAMARVVAGIVAVLVGGLTHAVAVAWFLISTCAVSDVADHVPAEASRQGLLCDRQEHWLNAAPYVALAASLLLSVALAVALWPKRGSARWLGLTACIWVPLLVSVALALPSDTCSPAQRRDLPERACSTRGGA